MSNTTLLGNQLLAQWLAPMVLTRWAEIRIPPNPFWGGDLMEGNPCDPSHLRVRELWIWVVIRPIIAQINPHAMSNSDLRELWVWVVVRLRQ